mmetsp:Transcript_20872/g.31501  ORF Transcript_20872/g.31501 Transcript_20872/m.31501 type:complete len:83 (+) Transcript_20872:341-589(+)
MYTTPKTEPNTNISCGHFTFSRFTVGRQITRIIRVDWAERGHIFVQAISFPKSAVCLGNDDDYDEQQCEKKIKKTEFAESDR